MIDLTFEIELLDEKTCTLTPGNRSEANNSVTRHTGESTLVGGSNESHVVYALVTGCTQADLVLGSVPPNVATAIAYLGQHGRVLSKSFGLSVFVIIGCGARLALRSLYPEPGTSSVKNELMRLMLTAKVHSAENLDVKEV